MSEAPRFGTAGLSDSYRVRSFDPQAMAEYTASFGLTAFEYQCGRGVRLGLDKAAALKEAFDAKDITFSVHAPYYISMSSLEEDKRLNSVNYLLQSCALVKALGGRRVIFHAGSCGKQSREAALEKALDTMRRAVQAVDEAGYGDCILCPETMGKVNQLGTLDEVLALCSVDERITPCVDFGHLYARSQGTELNDETAPADYAAILDAIAAALPGERAKKFHAHFSRIAYTKGGEKCHLTFADTEFGPPPAPLMQLLKTRGLAPTIICESAGTQAEDAAALMIYAPASDLSAEEANILSEYVKSGGKLLALAGPVADATAGVVAAGEALNPDLFDFWKEHTGLTIFEGFGQTETPLTVANLTHAVPKPGSMGRPSPAFNIEVQRGDGSRCDVGETGEVCIDVHEKAPGIMLEYYRNPEKTEAAVFDGWYHTGDTAWVDEDGFFWYVGRNDDVIKSSGYRIGPFEIESVLLEHDSVRECAVTGVPDPMRGKAVKATVVLAEGFEGSEVLVRELQQWVKQRTAPYKYPRIVEFVDALPKTVNGKIRRAAIREADESREGKPKTKVPEGLV